MIFNSKKVTSLVNQWQISKKPAILEEIAEECVQLAEVIASQFSDDNNYREDLIQECLTRLSYALPHYDSDVADLHKYLTSVFRNRCITTLGKISKQDKMASVVLEQGVELVAHPQESSNILQELVLRNRLRFPSIDAEICDGLTVHVYEYLLDGSQPGYGKGILKDAMQKFPELNRHEILMFYHSMMAYLRMTYEDFALRNCQEPDEFSLLHDVQDVLGEKAYERLVLVFAGMNIKIPT